MQECPSWAGVFPPSRKWLRPAWAVWNLLDRAPDTMRSYRHDLVFLQREMLSTFVTWEPLTKAPRVLDVDDAIWAHPRGDFARRLAGLSDHVICGNQFLAEQFSQWNRNITILPTPVDTSIFCPKANSRDEDRPIIGWMGLPSGFKYLYGIEEGLQAVLEKHPRAVLRIVSSHRPDFRTLPSEQIQWIPWTPENEARTIQEMTIGIMPLDDTVISRGKCSYKMLLYMACGVPVVVSPVGMNVEILQQGNVGFGAATQSEWADSLDELLRNEDLGSRMGRTGCDIVMKHYSIQVLVEQLAKTLSHVAGRTPEPLANHQGATF